MLNLPAHWSESLKQEVTQTYNNLKKRPNHSLFRKTIAPVLAASEFVSKMAIQQPDWLNDLFEQGLLKKRLNLSDYQTQASQLVANANTLPILMKSLRIYRQCEVARLIWRDIAKLDTVDQTLQQLSHLAESCIQQALNKLYEWQTQKDGTPHDQKGNPVPLIVLALGKLGGQELNLSSDVDLQFIYTEKGQLQKNNHSISHEEFFTKLSQQLIKVLHEVTQDGFVYRVDMRLRPFGRSGPLVNHLPSLLSYYQEQGRDWERYALVKARVICGHGYKADQLLSTLHQFVYRRYIDYSILDGLRKIKKQIDREARSQHMQHNIKTGPGGIREIEFIVQTFQVIRAGRDDRLQTQHLNNALLLLGKLKSLPKSIIKQLSQSYAFLRRLENALQGINDQQTHCLPEQTLLQQRLCAYLDIDHWDTLLAQWRAHQHTVQLHFKNMIADQPEHLPQEKYQRIREALEAIWLQRTENTDILVRIGFSNPEKIQDQLAKFRGSHRYRRLSTIARAKLNQLMPILLIKIADALDPMCTLQRMLHILDAILQRSAYLSLLIENPNVLAQVIDLVSKSDWITQQLANYPIVLTELLSMPDQQQPYSRLPLKQALTDRIQQCLQNEEDYIDYLRYFRHTHTLRIAIADLRDNLFIMRVSDYLTDLATVILHAVITLAARHLIERHGYPVNQHQQAIKDGLIIIGYGKLGGIELSYPSDLDLVFLHEAESQPHKTNGPIPIDATVFYTRLAQRILHMLSIQTTSGRLYDIDTRLRPSGQAGTLISTLDAFGHYQRETAWTWEHQALVRSRPIYANARQAKQYWDLRRQVLSQIRDKTNLCDQILAMRTKLSSSKMNLNQNQFDLKHSPGGIIDIEFLVQYAVLRWAHDHPELTVYTDNVRLLTCLKTIDKLPNTLAQGLIDAYCAYRALWHRQSLTRGQGIIDRDQVAVHIDAVQTGWEHWLGAREKAL